MKLRNFSSDELPTHHVMRFTSQGLAYSTTAHSVIIRSHEDDARRSSEIDRIVSRVRSKFRETSDYSRASE